jgi:hypothetical protein
MFFAPNTLVLIAVTDDVRRRKDGSMISGTELRLAVILNMTWFLPPCFDASDEENHCRLNPFGVLCVIKD